MNYSGIHKQFREHHESDEKKLWDEIKTGNKLAFRFFYDRYFDDLFHYGRRMTSSEPIVEDSIHDVFTDIWRYRQNITITTSLKAYLFKSLQRKVIKACEKSKKNLFLADDIIRENIVNSVEDDMVSEQMELEKKKEFQDLLSLLTKRQKEAIRLKYQDNFTHEEISGMMNLSLESTYNLLSKAITRLKSYIKK